MPGSISNINDAYGILAQGFGPNFSHGTPMEHVIQQLLQRIDNLESRIADLSRLVSINTTPPVTRSTPHVSGRRTTAARYGQRTVTTVQELRNLFDRPTHYAVNGETTIHNGQVWLMTIGGWELIGQNPETNATLGDGDIAGALEPQEAKATVSELHPAHNSSFVLKI